MKTVNERLAEAREALGFSRKADFAKHVDIERSTYDRLEKGPHKPSGESLEAIALRCPRLNLNWIMTGRGPMLFDDVPTAQAATVPQPTPGLTSGPATVAEAENVLLREQVADLRQQVARLWSLSGLMEKLGKMPSNLEAAVAMIREAFGQQAGATELALR